MGVGLNAPAHPKKPAHRFHLRFMGLDQGSGFSLDVFRIAAGGVVRAIRRRSQTGTHADMPGRPETFSSGDRPHPRTRQTCRQAVAPGLSLTPSTHTSLFWALRQILSTFSSSNRQYRVWRSFPRPAIVPPCRKIYSCCHCGAAP